MAPTTRINNQKPETFSNAVRKWLLRIKAGRMMAANTEIIAIKMTMPVTISWIEPPIADCNALETIAIGMVNPLSVVTGVMKSKRPIKDGIIKVSIVFKLCIGFFWFTVSVP